MATKTRTRKAPARKESETMQPSHLSAHIMLSSQLVSTGRFNEGLPAFITRGLDAEQIWQQLELRNEHKMSLTACTREVLRIQLSGARMKNKQKKKGKKMKSEKPNEEAEENSVHSDDTDSDESMLDSIKKRLAEQPSTSSDSNKFGLGPGSDEDDLDFDFEMDKEISKGLSDEDDIESSISSSKDSRRKAKQTSKRTSLVDDRFFKLDDMERFLDSEDLKEEKRRKLEEKQDLNGEKSDEEDDDDVEEDIDMFQDLDDDDEDDAKGAKYSDFFDPPDDSGVSETTRRKSDEIGGEESSGSDEIEEKELESDNEHAEAGTAFEDDEDNESDDDEEEMGQDASSEGESDTDNLKESKAKKEVSFANDLFMNSDEEDEDKASELASGQTKSTFEEKQERIQAQAREMEEQSLKETPWELTGEATASKRPENSLLETVLDFQHTTRAAPVITDETTKTLEDYIKQRIKDKAFDDVERKVKPKEDPFEFKKRVVLDQEKSKISLGELYEQEFMKQQQQDKEEVKADPECEKVETDLKKLFQQLDALCNFRYTPVQAGTEVKIIVNTPAITMEEVAPTATADAQLLAPEEVKEKIRGDLKAKDEKDKTDKSNERRLKKKEKRQRKKDKEAREKVVEKLKPGLGNKYSKEKALKKLEQISKSDRNVTMIKGDQQKLSSSTSFFNQLQDEVQTNVRAKKGAREKKKKSKDIDASKLML